MIRYSGGAAILDVDAWIDYSSPGPLGDGQTVEFTLKPTSAYGRKGFPIATA